ncbi:MAG: hypothetical protein RIC55_07020 [Pirellulaceae bacterium]
MRSMLAGGALAGLGELGFLARLPRVSADEAKLDPKVVGLRPEIEPLVRLLEETPRGKLLEEVAQRVKQGASYQDVLAALLLAGVRNIQPRPSVGFKFHAVLVVNSAHIASMASPDEQRWLPIFWALDHFKSSQARDVQEGDWTMGPVDESAVPSADKARQAFTTAMDDWDESAADAAVAALARTHGATEIVDLFIRYGCRDFRSIGHKAIYVANSWRTLQCIGWRHSEPVLRSLAYALLMHEGSNPAKRDDDADRHGRENVSRAKKIRGDGLAGKLDDGATGELLTALRSDSPEQCCDLVVELLNRGTSPQSLWDALLTGSGELLIRQSGIVSLHAVTTTNALRFAFQTAADDETRRLVLLQNAAFLPLFREAMRGRGRVGEFDITELAPEETKQQGEELITATLNDVGRNNGEASRKLLAYLQNGGDAREFIQAARVLVFTKGNDAHDYKFSSAVLEDYYHVSPAWRNRYLAAGVYNLQGTTARDNDLVQRTRAALTG